MFERSVLDRWEQRARAQGQLRPHEAVLQVWPCRLGNVGDGGTEPPWLPPLRSRRISSLMTRAGALILSDVSFFLEMPGGLVSVDLAYVSCVTTLSSSELTFDVLGDGGTVGTVRLTTLFDTDAMSMAAVIDSARIQRLCLMSRDDLDVVRRACGDRSAAEVAARWLLADAQRASDPAEARFALARILHERGRLDEARRLYLATAIDPTHPHAANAAIGLGRTLAALNDHRGAISAFRHALGYDTAQATKSWLQRRIGAHSRKVGDLHAARLAYENVLTYPNVGNSHARARRHLAGLAEANGEINTAIDLLRDLDTGADPATAQAARYDLAFLLLRQGQTRDAAQAYKAVAADTSSAYAPRAWLILGHIHYDNDDLAGALDAFARAAAAGDAAVAKRARSAGRIVRFKRHLPFAYGLVRKLVTPPTVQAGGGAIPGFDSSSRPRR